MSVCPPDYMAHLVEVQHERGASGGHTFHGLLSASLAPRRGQCPQSSYPSYLVVYGERVNLAIVNV